MAKRKRNNRGRKNRRESSSESERSPSPVSLSSRRRRRVAPVSLSSRRRRRAPIVQPVVTPPTPLSARRRRGVNYQNVYTLAHDERRLRQVFADAPAQIDYSVPNVNLNPIAPGVPIVPGGGQLLPDPRPVAPGWGGGMGEREDEVANDDPGYVPPSPQDVDNRFKFSNIRTVDVQIVPNTSIMHLWASCTHDGNLPSPHSYGVVDEDNNNNNNNVPVAQPDTRFPEWEEALIDFVTTIFRENRISRVATLITVQFTFVDVANGAHNTWSIIMKDANENDWAEDETLADFAEKIAQNMVKMLTSGGLRSVYSTYDNIMPEHVSRVLLRAIITGWRNKIPSVGCEKKHIKTRIGPMLCLGIESCKNFKNSCVLDCVLDDVKIWENLVYKKAPLQADRQLEFCLAFQDFLLLKKGIIWLNDVNLFNPDWLPHLAEFANITIVLMNHENGTVMKIINGDALEAKPFSRIVFYEGHCYKVLKEAPCMNCNKQHRNGKNCTRCPDCYRWVNDVRLHTCNMARVLHASETFRANDEPDHGLHLRSKSIYERVWGPKIIIAFDCESFFDQKGNHRVYVVGAKAGILQMNAESNQMEYADSVYIQFKGQNCVKEFFDWTISIHSQFRKTLNTGNKKVPGYVIAYNGCKYDFILMMRTMVSYAKVYGLSNIVMTSGEVTSFEYGIHGNKLKIRDLIKLMGVPMRLADAAKAFKLDETMGLAKGEFPHLWLGNQEDPWKIVEEGYEGPHPAKSDYIKPKDFPDPVPSIWNFAENSEKYLKSDVEILYELTRLLTDTIYTSLKMNLLDRFTAPQLAYEFWVSLMCPFSLPKQPKNGFHGDNAAEKKKLYLEARMEKMYHPFANLVTPRLIRVVRNLNNERLLRQAIYGGLVYPTRFSFRSKQYEQVLKKEIDFDKVDDFEGAFDFSGLYAHSMRKFKFPHGQESPRIDRPDKINNLLQSLEKIKLAEDVPMFIAYLKRVCPKHLAIPVLPRRQNHKLRWDLKDGEAMYTSVDIWMAYQKGYQFAPAKADDGRYFAVSWDLKDTIFQNTMLKGTELRELGAKTGNTLLDLLGKILQNSLYGKMGQLPIYLIIKILLSENMDKEFEEFFDDNIIKSWFTIQNEEDQSIVAIGLQGETKNKEEHISKPVHLAAFILAWARYIMQEEEDIIDPNHSNDPYNSIMRDCQVYRDTDSVIANMDCNKFDRYVSTHIPPEKELGKMFWDLKGGVTKVVDAVYLAPKTYMLAYITRDKNDQRNYKLQYKMRAKGMPSEFLEPKLYYDLLAAVYRKLDSASEEDLANEDWEPEISEEDRQIGERRLNSIKKVVLNVNSKQASDNRMNFGAYNTWDTRCLLRKIYFGRKPVFNKREKQWILVPWGYDESIIHDGPLVCHEPEPVESILLPAHLQPEFEGFVQDLQVVETQEESQSLVSMEEIQKIEDFLEYPTPSELFLEQNGLFQLSDLPVQDPPFFPTVHDDEFPNFELAMYEDLF